MSAAPTTPAPMPLPPETVYISFSAEINPTTAEGLLKACCDLATKGVKTLYILLSTPGGSVTHGVTIYNVLKSLPCKVVMHNVGGVDSIGNVVFLAGQERYANLTATFMFHGVGFDGQNVRLDERALLERLDGIRADQKKIGAIIRERTTITNEEEVEGLFLAAATKDAHFAKDRGIIHEIREAKLPEGAAIFQLVFQR